MLAKGWAENSDEVAEEQEHELEPRAEAARPQVQYRPDISEGRKAFPKEGFGCASGKEPQVSRLPRAPGEVGCLGMIAQTPLRLTARTRYMASPLSGGNRLTRHSQTKISVPDD